MKYGKKTIVEEFRKLYKIEITTIDNIVTINCYYLINTLLFT